MAVGDHVTSIADGDRTRGILGERVRIYRNDWDDLLTAELKRQFVPETWENINLMLDTSQNVFRRIVRETCTIYKEGVQRELMSPSAEGKAQPVEVPRYREVLDQLDMDCKMAEAHRIAKASWVCFVRPRVVLSSGEMRLDIITPDISHVDLEDDDPFAMKGFGYMVSGKDKHGNIGTWWVYYTADQIRYLDSTGIEVENPFSDNLDTTNPYGVIPVVPFFATTPSIEFWDLHWNKDAVRANYIIGVLNTYINYLVKTQSFKQIAFTGTPGQDVLNAISDPLFPLVLPEGATAATLDLNTQLEAIDNVIRGKVIAIANNYGISPENFSVTGTVASGYALKIANRSLEEIRAADKDVAMRTERDLFDLIRLINNMEYPDQIPDYVTLDWDPGEIEYPLSSGEEQSRWNFEFDNGISNAIDYLIDENPDLTRDEAMAKLTEIREENKVLKPEPSVLETVFGQGGKPNPFQKKVG